MKTWNVIDTEPKTPHIAFSFESREEFEESFPDGIQMEGFVLEVIEGRKVFGGWLEAYRWACMCLQAGLADQVCLSACFQSKSCVANFETFRPNTQPAVTLRKTECCVGNCKETVYKGYHRDGSQSGFRCKRCNDKLVAT